MTATTDAPQRSPNERKAALLDELAERIANPDKSDNTNLHKTRTNQREDAKILLRHSAFGSRHYEAAEKVLRDAESWDVLLTSYRFWERRRAGFGGDDGETEIGSRTPDQ